MVLEFIRRINAENYQRFNADEWFELHQADIRAMRDRLRNRARTGELNRYLSKLRKHHYYFPFGFAALAALFPIFLFISAPPIIEPGFWMTLVLAGIAAGFVGGLVSMLISFLWWDIGDFFGYREWLFKLRLANWQTIQSDAVEPIYEAKNLAESEVAADAAPAHLRMRLLLRRAWDYIFYTSLEFELFRLDSVNDAQNDNWALYRRWVICGLSVILALFTMAIALSLDDRSHATIGAASGALIAFAVAGAIGLVFGHKRSRDFVGEVELCFKRDLTDEEAKKIKVPAGETSKYIWPSRAALEQLFCDFESMLQERLDKLEELRGHDYYARRNGPREGWDDADEARPPQSDHSVQAKAENAETEDEWESGGGLRGRLDRVFRRNKS